MAKFTCTSCGGDMFDVVRTPDRVKKCRCCGHETPFKSRMSVKQKQLEAALRFLLETNEMQRASESRSYWPSHHRPASADRTNPTPHSA